ncbi:ABC transporter ATP-binding protein [Thermosyntropha sp.]|uniref:ABC transporter ATP-binding protein n=1 Tax=Thermosyntropha sp. TaxID=2740820 RepID=UPI0025D88145|nr:ABC transporter ATP-binding protein [Thermosyntropha sp.]MBO8159212.1 ABC transporter ATP-binding protein [Thermosyntropha sp.]
MLQLEGVNKVFKNNGSFIHVLKDIDFTVNSGEFFCIVGPSGCGKTTLLRSIGGYEKISGGQILIDGKKITEPGIDRVMVFQSFEQLFSWKTVKENIEYPLKITGVSKQKRNEYVRKYVKMMGLEGFENYYPHQLSGGMKQRTALARALALNPEILLMDEPFANLDAQTREVLQKELLKIWQELKPTIIFVTHAIDEAIILADRILVMSKQGRIKTIIESHLERPRRPSMKGFSAMWDILYSLLGSDDNP